MVLSSGFARYVALTLFKYIDLNTMPNFGFLINITNKLTVQNQILKFFYKLIQKKAVI